MPPKLVEKFMWKQNMKSFSNETLNFFLRKFWDSYILDLAKTAWALRILSQKSTRNFAIKELWELEKSNGAKWHSLVILFHSIGKMIQNDITWKVWVIGKTREMESTSVWKQQHSTIIRYITSLKVEKLHHSIRTLYLKMI